MSRRNAFMVQHLERRTKDVVARHGTTYRTPDEALARAERDANMFSGIVTYEVVIETETGEEVEASKLLARFSVNGERPDVELRKICACRGTGGLSCE
jgi:hypothetical protein